MNVTPTSAINFHSAASPVFGDDEIVQLREWGTEQTCKLSHRLPQDGTVEVEKATLRIIALNITHSVSQAARRLGIAAVSLSRWLDRRMPLPDRTARRNS